MNGFHLRLSLACPGCGQAVPLDAMAPVVMCTRCGRGAPIALLEWKRILETAILQTAAGQERVNVQVADASIEGLVAPASPRCRCRALFTEDELSTTGGAQPWLLHRCGAQVLVRSFPELDTIGRVLGESNPSAPSPPGAGFVVTLRGWLDERIRNALRFTGVTQALVDAAGNLYCVGALYATTPRDDDDYAEAAEEEEEEEEEEDDVFAKDDDHEYAIESLWSCDAALRPRWKVELSSTPTRIGLLAPDSITCATEEESEPTTLSTADGSGFGAPTEVVNLAGYRQALRDADGTWIVVTQKAVARVAPAQGWKAIPLFAVEGFFARMTASDELECTWGAAIALASDGDLVVHHAEIGEKPPQLSRFDRHGHRKLSVSSPLGGTFGHDTQLATGVGGIVWAWGQQKLCAVTPVAVHPISLPPDAERLGPAIAAMPDGSLLFFGEEGRVVRAAMNGLAIVRWERLGGV